MVELGNLRVRASHHIEPERMISIGNLSRRDQGIDIACEGGGPDRVGFAGLDLKNQVEPRRRCPMAIKPDLALDALIASEGHGKFQKVPHMIDQILERTAILISRVAEAYFDIIADFSNLG